MSISKLFFLLFFGGLVAFGGYAQTGAPQRNGQAELRVWDRSTKRFIYAGLGIYPVNVRHKKFAAMSTATGDDGASHTLSLAPGTYVVKVQIYVCNGKRYFSAKPPSYEFVVRTGRLQRKTLAVDVSKIRAKRSYDNLNGEPCSK